MNDTRTCSVPVSSAFALSLFTLLRSLEIIIHSQPHRLCHFIISLHAGCHRIFIWVRLQVALRYQNHTAQIFEGFRRVVARACRCADETTVMLLSESLAFANQFRPIALHL